ncbi:hypothetical protein BA724_12450 [Domibacillus iocasae]|uniref:Uncharacterized protein n=1 Tax=Domibacillus iocasae TaxID=1714016 RepID=A0A1E7DLL3_9BACI|nr:hypothetical protein BA724_12450 [Domibacillus iocasae]
MKTSNLTYLQSIRYHVVDRLAKSKCALCKIKGEPLFQVNQKNRKRSVCSKCAVYAEARIFRKNA